MFVEMKSPSHVTLLLWFKMIGNKFMKVSCIAEISIRYSAVHLCDCGNNSQKNLIPLAMRRKPPQFIAFLQFDSFSSHLQAALWQSLEFIFSIEMCLRFSNASRFSINSLRRDFAENRTQFENTVRDYPCKTVSLMATRIHRERARIKLVGV